MKTALFIVLLCMALQNAAQEAKKKATVHIKKIENNDGIVKITDTTFTTDDVASLENGDASFQDIRISTDSHCKTVIVNEEVTGTAEKSDGFRKMVIYSDSAGGVNPYHVMKIESAISPEMEKAFKEAKATYMSFNTKDPGSIMMMGDAMVLQAPGDSRTMSKVIFIKAVKITDPTEAETKKASSDAGPTNGKLSVTDIKFYPNPSNGKFNLSFTTPGKGDAEITIVNSEGKKVFTESLPNFNGHYDKEVDLSENLKGVYFVRIQQGKHSQMKKLVIE